MTDIMHDLDAIWEFIAKEAKKPSADLEVKISIFDKGLKYASMKYKVQPDEIEGSAWNDYGKALQGHDSGGKSSGPSGKTGKKNSASRHNGIAATSNTSTASTETSSERHAGNGHA